MTELFGGLLAFILTALIIGMVVMVFAGFFDD
jgi:hypothetical protein